MGTLYSCAQFACFSGIRTPGLNCLAEGRRRERGTRSDQIRSGQTRQSQAASRARQYAPIFNTKRLKHWPLLPHGPRRGPAGPRDQGTRLHASCFIVAGKPCISLLVAKGRFSPKITDARIVVRTVFGSRARGWALGETALGLSLTLLGLFGVRMYVLGNSSSTRTRRGGVMR